MWNNLRDLVLVFVSRENVLFEVSFIEYSCILQLFTRSFDIKILSERKISQQRTTQNKFIRKRTEITIIKLELFI